MRFRAAKLVAVAVAIAAGATAGCRRSPLTEASAPDAGPDLSTEAPLPGDGSDGGLDAPLDATRDTAADDTGNADGPTDLSAGDARPGDADTSDARTDAPGDARSDARADATDSAVDRPADLSNVDAPADADVPDRASSDTSDVRPEEQPCGPLGFNCSPFACDVAHGLCKTTCASDDDCVGGPCIRGSCGRILVLPCTSNLECASGFCTDGACCQTACSGPCRSCSLAGTVGTCTPVAAGAPDPHGICPAGNLCDGRGGCLGAPCTTDTDCGPLNWCTGGRCAPCAATCASNADCPSDYCVMRNLCTYCDVRDAGAG